MPVIAIKTPEKVFNEEQISKMVSGVTAAASAAEGIPADPRKQAMIWVTVEEVKAFAGGQPAVPNMIPVVVNFYPPAGVLDKERRQIAVGKIHEAIVSAAPEDMRKRVLTSCVISDVSEGHWGINGDIWTLGQFAKIAGYDHLQDLA